ncbi:MAG: CocE/NonD family hydrolase [Gemmatimonadales bacterium]|nr:CocE/NonD family hydrolase [Gemmatimonadales bacterium]
MTRRIGCLGRRAGRTPALVMAWPLLAAGLAVAQPPIAPPAPRNEFVIERDVMVPMRDGVRLATNLHRPTSGGPRFPVVLIRTPYNKEAMPFVTTPARFFAGQGYVVVTQDVRGKFQSEGEFAVQMKDGDDGYDTIDWIARQPWSNGKVGTYGCSYMGEVQLLAAKRRHPAHAAMIPQSSTGAFGPAGGYYTNWGTYEGGTLTLSALFGWMGGSGSKAKGRSADLASLDFATLLKSLPIATMAERAGYPPSDFRDFVTHPPADPYWDQMGYVRDDDRFDVPALHVNSWFDVTPDQTMYLFNLMRRNSLSARARDNQFVVMSPTAHCLSEAAGAPTRVGDREFGDARLPYFQLYLDWFDHWLKGVDNGVTRRPRVQYYVTGANEWRTAATWPVPGVRPTRYFLGSGRGARTSAGDGRLTLEVPRPGRDSFRYDPADPVPSRGGTVCCTGNPKDVPGAFDQRDLETRPDLLVYTTPVLDSGVTIAGSVTAVLYVASDRLDTDFAAKLLDVDADGRSWNVANGVIRARYRGGMARPTLLTPGETVRVEVNLKATAHRFAPGHRIRLWVTSSDFPLHDRNLNTGGDNVTETSWLVATNVVHYGGSSASHLVLPITPER